MDTLTYRFNAQALHTSYLGVSSTEHVDHDLHDCLVHAQSSHQVRVLVEDLVVHYITAEDKGQLKNYTAIYWFW